MNRFYDGEDPEAFVASSDLLAFHDELLAEYPPLESYDDEEIDEVPTYWSMTRSARTGSSS